MFKKSIQYATLFLTAFGVVGPTVTTVAAEPSVSKVETIESDNDVVETVEQEETTTTENVEKDSPKPTDYTNKSKKVEGEDANPNAPPVALEEELLSDAKKSNDVAKNLTLGETGEGVNLAIIETTPKDVDNYVNSVDSKNTESKYDVTDDTEKKVSPPLERLEYVKSVRSDKTTKALKNSKSFIEGENILNKDMIAVLEKEHELPVSINVSKKVLDKYDLTSAGDAVLVIKALDPKVYSLLTKEQQAIVNSVVTPDYVKDGVNELDMERFEHTMIELDKSINKNVYDVDSDKLSYDDIKYAENFLFGYFSDYIKLDGIEFNQYVKPQSRVYVNDELDKKFPMTLSYSDALGISGKYIVSAHHNGQIVEFYRDGNAGQPDAHSQMLYCAMGLYDNLGGTKPVDIYYVNQDVAKMEKDGSKFPLDKYADGGPALGYARKSSDPMVSFASYQTFINVSRWYDGPGGPDSGPYHSADQVYDKLNASANQDQPTPFKKSLGLLDDRAKAESNMKADQVKERKDFIDLVDYKGFGDGFKWAIRYGDKDEKSYDAGEIVLDKFGDTADTKIPAEYMDDVKNGMSADMKKSVKLFEKNGTIWVEAVATTSGETLSMKEVKKDNESILHPLSNSLMYSAQYSPNVTGTEGLVGAYSTQSKIGYGMWGLKVEKVKLNLSVKVLGYIGVDLDKQLIQNGKPVSPDSVKDVVDITSAVYELQKDGKPVKSNDNLVKDAKVIKGKKVDHNGNFAISPDKDGHMGIRQLITGSYTLKEVVAPEGTDIDTKSYAFSEKTGKPDSDGLPLTSLTGDNGSKDVLINLGFEMDKKTPSSKDSAKGNVSFTDNAQSSINKDKVNMTEAVYQLYKNGQPVAASDQHVSFVDVKKGTRNDQNGNVAFSPDKDGKLLFHDLLAGKNNVVWTIKEVKAPKNTTLSSAVYTLSRTADKDEDGCHVTKMLGVADGNGNASLDNIRVTGIDFQKSGVYGDRYDGDLGTSLVENAEYTLYDAKDDKPVLRDDYRLEHLTVTKGAVKAGDANSTVFITNKKGEIAFTNVIYGEYYLKETKASQGYLLDEEKYYFGDTDKEPSKANTTQTAEKNDESVVQNTTLLKNDGSLEQIQTVGVRLQKRLTYNGELANDPSGHIGSSIQQGVPYALYYADGVTPVKWDKLTNIKDGQNDVDNLATYSQKYDETKLQNPTKDQLDLLNTLKDNVIVLTDEKGFLEIRNLPRDKYALREVTANPGQQIDPTTYYFGIEAPNTYVGTALEETPSENKDDVIPADVLFDLTGDKGSHDAVTGFGFYGKKFINDPDRTVMQAENGVKFTLTPVEDTTENVQTVYNPVWGDEISTIADYNPDTDEDGYFEFRDLPLGRYEMTSSVDKEHADGALIDYKPITPIYIHYYREENGTYTMDMTLKGETIPFFVRNTEKGGLLTQVEIDNTEYQALNNTNNKLATQKGPKAPKGEAFYNMGTNAPLLDNPVTRNVDLKIKSKASANGTGAITELDKETKLSDINTLTVDLGEDPKTGKPSDELPKDFGDYTIEYVLRRFDNNDYAQKSEIVFREKKTMTELGVDKVGEFELPAVTTVVDTTNDNPYVTYHWSSYVRNSKNKVIYEHNAESNIPSQSVPVIPENPGKNVTIRTNAFVNGLKVINTDDLGKGTLMEDDVITTGVELGDIISADLIKLKAGQYTLDADGGLIPNDGVDVNDHIIYSEDLIADQDLVTSQKTRFKTAIDTSNDEEGDVYFWREYIYDKDDTDKKNPLVVHNEKGKVPSQWVAVKNVWIKTKAQFKDGEKHNEPSKEAEILDNIESGGFKPGDKIVSDLIRLEPGQYTIGENGELLIKPDVDVTALQPVASISFDVDDEYAVKQQKTVEATIDTSNDSDGVVYFWREYGYDKDDNKLAEHNENGRVPEQYVVIDNPDKPEPELPLDIKTKAHNGTNEQFFIINKDEKGKPSQTTVTAYDDIWSSGLKTNNVIVSELIKLSPNDYTMSPTGEIKINPDVDMTKPNVVASIEFEVDDKYAVEQQTQVTKDLDITNDEVGTIYFWREYAYENEEARKNGEKPLVVHNEDGSVPEQWIVVRDDKPEQGKPVTPTPKPSTPETVPEKIKNAFTKTGQVVLSNLPIIGAISLIGFAGYYIYRKRRI